jgi:hypothetical protein
MNLHTGLERCSNCRQELAATKRLCVGLIVNSSAWLQILELVLEHAQSNESLAGSFFWSAVGSLHSDCDAFSVRLSPPATISPIAESSKSSLPPQRKEGEGEQAESVSIRSSESLPGATMKLDEELPDGQHGVSHANDVCSPGQGRDQESSGSIWLDEELVEVLKQHSKAMAALTSSWRDCPLM